MAARLTVDCLGLSFQNPVLVASGTFGYGDEYYDIMPFSRLGGLVTKTVTAAPRQGNPPPRVVETDSGMLNSIGLANVGLEVFIREKLPWIVQHAGGARVVVNFAGFSVDEFIGVGAGLAGCRGIDALEVNLGCPNVKAGSIHFGADPATVREVIAGLRGEVGLPLVAKLTPNVADIAALAEVAVEAGADALSLINTLPGMKIDVKKRKPALGMAFGGLSGPALRPVGVACVYKVYRRLQEMGAGVPVIGIGGIATGPDALEYILAGARLVQVGTASFVNPLAAGQVVAELAAWCENEGIGDLSELVGVAHHGGN
ncbi:MAG: dihydroorotate dehydrogenase [Candidatus Glassbacteria bacterium]|nr:dihydroorotate dehydrogenase [Candidatus Glassbacteria bacterium]